MRALELRILRMGAGHIDRVMAIAAELDEAPDWPRAVYEQARNPNHTPRRIALVAMKESPGTAEDTPEFVAGFAIAGLLPPEAELETIAVAREGQRGGVGAMLMRALVEELRGAGVTDLNLEVRASNTAAIGLYRSLGFTETGRRPRYYADPEEDAVLMRLRFARKSQADLPEMGR